MKLQKGQRIPLELDTSSVIEVSLTAEPSGGGAPVHGFVCAGVDEAGKISDRRFLVYHSQPSSPGGEVALSGGRLTLKLDSLPDTVNKLVIAIGVDPPGTVSQFASLRAEIIQNGAPWGQIELAGGEFSRERAVSIAEIYRKNGWRIAVIASGFFGGITELLTLFGCQDPPPSVAIPSPGARNDSQSNGAQDSGGTAASENASGTADRSGSAGTGANSSSGAGQNEGTPGGGRAQSGSSSSGTRGGDRVDLERRIGESSPDMRPLARPVADAVAFGSMEGLTAKVALVIDACAAMRPLYEDGTVRSIVNKTVPLALGFDDDGVLDMWYFASKFRKMPPVNAGNYTNMTPHQLKQLSDDIGSGAHIPRVMKDVIQEYKASAVPAFVLFFLRGGILRSGAIQKLLVESSSMPIFWQFIGLGSEGFGVLNALDTIRGRKCDNANFFTVANFGSVPDGELFRRMLSTFPVWLSDAKANGIIR